MLGFDSLEEQYFKLVDKPSDINQHLPKLYEIAKDCKNIVEFGVRRGCSTIAFLAGGAKVFSYDLEPHNIHDKILHWADPNQWYIVYGDIKKTAVKTSPPECDAMFFDSEHSYDQLMFELQFTRQARKYLIFHDTVTFWHKANVEGKMGIGPAIEQFIAANPDWATFYESKENNGLLILKRK